MIKSFILAALLAASLSFAQVSSIPTAAGGGTSTFDNVGSGTNTTATLTCGSGCTLVTTAGIFRLPNGTSAPGTCTVGDAFFDTDATAGLNFYGCTATNTWTLLGDGGSGSTAFTDIADLKVTKTSDTVLTVAAGNYRYLASDGTYSVASLSSATLTVASGTETAGTAVRFSIDENSGSPIIRCIVATSLTSGNYTASGCTKTSADVFPAGNYQLASAGISSGVWGTPVDGRTMAGVSNYSAGTGLTKTGNSLAVNSAVVPFLAGATTGMPFGSVASDPSSPNNGDCWYDTAQARFECRENGSTVAMIGGGGGGGVKRYAFSSKPTCDSSITDVMIVYTDVYQPVKSHCNGTSYQEYFGDVPVTPPPTTGWTNYSGGPGVAGKNIYRLTSGTSTANREFRVVPGSTPYTITAGVRMLYVQDASNPQYPSFQFCVTNGTVSANEQQCIAVYLILTTPGNAIRVQTEKGATDLAATGTTYASIYGLSGLVDQFYVRYYDNGTNRYWYVGKDLDSLLLIDSESRTANLTATHYSFSANPGGSGIAQDAIIFHLTEN